jgi:hypothetical protein
MAPAAVPLLAPAAPAAPAELPALLGAPEPAAMGVRTGLPTVGATTWGCTGALTLPAAVGCVAAGPVAGAVPGPQLMATQLMATAQPVWTKRRMLTERAMTWLN